MIFNIFGHLINITNSAEKTNDKSLRNNQNA